MKIFFLDLPDFVQGLNFNYWTALSRQGCVGTIKNCFSNRSELVASYRVYESYFWRMFDTTANGACVALQTLPYGVDQDFGEKQLTRYSLGPLFDQCKNLNYFACEAKGPRSKLINEEELWVLIIY